MLKKALLILILIFPVASFANNDKFTLIGKGALNIFVWHVYDIKLYAEDKAFSYDRPFYLKIEYKRDAYGKKIAKISADEIRKLGFEDEQKLSQWLVAMESLFPDIKAGDSLTGVYQPNQAAIFLKNDAEIGAIEDPDFARWFFGIWLDENTSQPSLRKSLLGLAP